MEDSTVLDMSAELCLKPRLDGMMICGARWPCHVSAEAPPRSRLSPVAAAAAAVVKVLIEKKRWGVFILDKERREGVGEKRALVFLMLRCRR